MKFPKFALVPILPVSLILMAGCDSDDDFEDTFNPPAVAQGEVRYTHAAADAAPVRFAVDGNYRAGSLDYTATSGLTSYYVGEEALNIAVAAPVAAPGGPAPTLTAIDSVEFSVETEIRVDVFAVGSAGSYELLTLTAPTVFDASDTSARVVVAHLAPDAPAVDVYVTAPDAALGGATAVGSLSYLDDLEPAILTAGAYRIRVTAAGNSDVIFDSGEVELEAGDDLVIGAVANEWIADSTDKAPIALMVLADDNTSTLLFDAADPAELRIANLAPTDVTTGFDVILEEDLREGETAAETTLATDLELAEVTDYEDFTVTTENYNVFASATGTDTSFLDEASIAPVSGRVFTSFVADAVTELQFFTVQDSPREVASAAKLRAIHGSALAGTVDIYVTEGDVITAADPIAADVELGSATAYLYLPADTYYVTITAANSKTPAVGPLLVTLANGDVVTAIAHDTDTGTVNVLVLEDSAEAAAAVE